MRTAPGRFYYRGIARLRATKEFNWEIRLERESWKGAEKRVGLATLLRSASRLGSRLLQGLSVIYSKNRVQMRSDGKEVLIEDRGFERKRKKGTFYNKF